MSKQIDALKLALEALEKTAVIFGDDSLSSRAAEAVKEALAQPEQEPVAWLIWLHGPAGHFDHKQFAELEFERRNKEYPDPDRKLLPLYTTPPQRKPLTDEETHEVIGTAGVDLLELAKLWSDNKIHVYQFDNEARKIIKGVLHRAHNIKE